MKTNKTLDKIVRKLDKSIGLDKIIPNAVLLSPDIFGKISRENMLVYGPKGVTIVGLKILVLKELKNNSVILIKL